MIAEILFIVFEYKVQFFSSPSKLPLFYENMRSRAAESVICPGHGIHGTLNIYHIGMEKLCIDPYIYYICILDKMHQDAK